MFILEPYQFELLESAGIDIASFQKKYTHGKFKKAVIEAYERLIKEGKKDLAQRLMVNLTLIMSQNM